MKQTTIRRILPTPSTSVRSAYAPATPHKATMPILFDKLLPKWNYVAKPR